MAMNLACNTTLTRKQVLAVLRDTPAAHAPAPANGNRTSRNPNLGTDRAGREASGGATDSDEGTEDALGSEHERGSES